MRESTLCVVILAIGYPGIASAMILRVEGVRIEALGTYFVLPFIISLFMPHPYKRLQNRTKRRLTLCNIPVLHNNQAGPGMAAHPRQIQAITCYGPRPVENPG